RAFTLFEVVLALIIFSMIVGVIFAIYINMQKSQVHIKNEQLIIQDSSDFLDQLNNLSFDYTIDYEEYFNRSMVGCNTGDDSFQRNNSGACDMFTDYGNTATGDSFYYCSLTGNGSQSGYAYYGHDATILGCPVSGSQYFGEYKRQFRDIVDSNLNNGDDVFFGTGPVAIINNTGVQELYLINKKGDHRIFFRRKSYTGDNARYSIQMLKLKGFDAGTGHDFSTGGNWGVHDCFVDTRACDAEAGFVCSGDIVLTGDDIEYRLPADIDDGRVDITDADITVSSRNFELYPSKDPYLAQNDRDAQIDPYVQINLKIEPVVAIQDQQIELSTTLGFKSSYFNFASQTGFTIPEFSGEEICSADFVTVRSGTIANIGINSSYTYNYNLCCDYDTGSQICNESLFSGLTSSSTCSYTGNGPHYVRITGLFPAPSFSNKNNIIGVYKRGGCWLGMDSSFKNCSNFGVFSGSIDNPDLSNVTSLNYTFEGCTSFNQDLSDWDVSNISSFYVTFRKASTFNQDLSDWDMNQATTINGMFNKCTNFNQDLSDWDMSNVTNMFGTFDDTSMSTANYDSFLISLSGSTIQTGVFLGADGVDYCLGSGARTYLVDDLGRNINDGDYDCSEYDDGGGMVPET
ncbi:MAG TPA: BspA family leucine-rich repeat surface protein, partial [Candidatus Absconditabacterales bacterium]|nr:BspA family leucine-rich repeat surface protein [Candidatus Absconditabacterales bacterium]